MPYVSWYSWFLGKLIFLCQFQTNEHDLIGSECHYVAIKQALNGSMPNIKERSQLVCFKEDEITLNTVVKAESLYQLIYLIYLMLQVNVNQRNYSQHCSQSGVSVSTNLSYISYVTS